MNVIGPTQTIIGWLCSNYFKVVAFENMQILYKRNSITFIFIFFHITSFHLNPSTWQDGGYCSRYAPNGAQCRQWHQGLLPSGAPQRPGLILLQPAPRAGGGMLTAKMVHEGTTDVSR